MKAEPVYPCCGHCEHDPGDPPHAGEPCCAGGCPGGVPIGAVVTLRNGREVPRALVTPVLLSLEALLGRHPVALFELAALARDPSHALFGNTGQVLAELGLTEDGKLHDAVRDIVLAAIDGEGFDLRLVSPCGGEGK